MNKETRHVLSFLAAMIIRNSNNNKVSDFDMEKLKAIRDDTCFNYGPEPVPVLDIATDKPVMVRLLGQDVEFYMTALEQEEVGRRGGDLVYNVEIRLTAKHVITRRISTLVCRDLTEG